METLKNVLVTGIGGGVGQSILKAMADSGYGVVGVDSEALAAGLYAVPKAYLGHYANDERFVPRLLEICRAENCGLVFPGHDVELLPLARHRQRFLDAGVVPVVCSEDVVRTCDDKLATQVFLKAHGFPALETWTLRDCPDFRGPAVLKPQRGGARSRLTFLVRTPDEFAAARARVDPDNCVVQELVEGEEYTCGTVTFDRRCRGVIAMRRALRNGDTYKAFVEHPSPLEPVVRAMAEALDPFGACNFQLRVKNGVPYVFEINARCSGTTAARALAGFNEPRMVADHLLRGIEPAFSIREIGILRYWQELVVPNGRIAELRDHGVLAGDGTRL